MKLNQRREILTVHPDESLANIRNYLENPADLRIIPPQPAGAVSCSVIYLDGLVKKETAIYLLHASSPQELTEETREFESVLRDLARGLLILLKWENNICRVFSYSAPGWEKRPIREPVSEQLIRGPREGFTETISVNTAMLRRWITDTKLRVDSLYVGTRTETEVRLMYLGDVADPSIVEEVKERISAIRIDGILESGYLEQLITDNRFTLFPLIQSTERTDKAAAAILEGRVVILTDKSTFTLIVPTTVNELYQSPEDYYFNFYLGSFLRFFRLLGNNLAVTLSGLYVALASTNPELLPMSLALSIASSRKGIPYPIYIEVLMLEVMVEIFREAGLRLPGNINQVLGVVAGITLAFAAVEARLVSGASLVVVIIGAIASFSAPNFEVGIPWRIFKFVLIIGGATLGIIGLILTGMLILANAAVQTSFGVSYLAPWAPLRFEELRDSLFRVPLWLRKLRPKTYRARDRRRMGDKGDKNDGS